MPKSTYMYWQKRFDRENQIGKLRKKHFKYVKNIMDALDNALEIIADCRTEKLFILIKDGLTR